MSANLEREKRIAEEAWHRGLHMRDSEVEELRDEVRQLKAANKRLLDAAKGLQDEIEELQQQRAEMILKIAHLQGESEQARVEVARHV